MINALGYHNTRTEKGWRLTHHLVAEKKLGRPLKETEMVRFEDGDRTNMDPENIRVVIKNAGSLLTQRAKLEAQIEELQGRLKEVNEALASRVKREKVS